MCFINKILKINDENQFEVFISGFKKYPEVFSWKKYNGNYSIVIDSNFFDLIRQAF